MSTQQKNIAWSDAMLTGIPSIDDQHQILVNLLNVANDKLIENTSRVELEEIVRDLMSYAVYHFDTEEALMLTHEYPKEAQQQHIQEHRNFSAKIAKLQADFNRYA